MNRFIISALVLSGMTANAQQQQVGINTAEPKATLHVEAGASENKGVIIPRITAAEMKTMTTGLGADHHSMMTYLKEQMPTADRTGKLVDVAEPGYYYYDNTTGVQKWKTFGGGGEQDLRYINGNHLTQDAGIGGNGTSLGSSWGSIAIGPNTFYGFTNPADLSGGDNIAMGNNIYYNNGGTMQASGNTGIGNSLFQMSNGGTMQGGNNVALGNSMYNLSKANAQFTGNANFGIGHHSFNLNNGDLTGGGNFAIGFSSIAINTGNLGGSSNMGIGSSSIYVYTGDLSGQNNIALGDYAMYSNGKLSGNSNIAIGRNALNGGSSGITGSYNVGIGSGNYSYNLGEGNGNIAISAGNGIDTPGVMDNAVIIGSGSWGPLQDGTVAIGSSGYGAAVLLGRSGNKVGVGGITDPQAALDVNGAIKVGSQHFNCDSYQHYGIIRFDGANFYGCTPSGWKQLNN